VILGGKLVVFGGVFGIGIPIMEEYDMADA
jgi:hypothetical protein